MNIGYVIDLNGILNEEDLKIPQLSGLYFCKIDAKELNSSKILEIRNDVMIRINEAVEKHLFFFVMKNDKSILAPLSKCLDEIQADQQHYNIENNEVHVVCNMLDEADGFSIKEYEKHMTCLTKNNVCVYSWMMDKYDHNGDRPVSNERRAHAIARLAWMITKQYQVIQPSLLQMTQQTATPKPIYNLFGDACVFFDEEKRTRSVRDYYDFKNLQHLLNLPDGVLDGYLQENVLPYKDDRKALDKNIDATAEKFMRDNRVPIEASEITEKTQGLLLKSSDDDKEYLVNASDNKIVFIEELRKSVGWQLDGMDGFLSNYQSRVCHLNEEQDIVSQQFVTELRDKVMSHEREGFDRINNMVSESRRQHIDAFKKNSDKYLHQFLNRQEGNYVWLQETLHPQEAALHRSNVDYGVAFMEYLESGRGDYLVDLSVSMGDTNFTRIKEDNEREEKARRKEYKEKKEEFEATYYPHEDDEPAKVLKKFSDIDEKIKKCRTVKLQCDYQVNHWIDGDAEKKLTARTRAAIAIASGILAAAIWLFVSMKYLSSWMQSLFEHYARFQWGLFSAFILAGVIVGAIIFIKALRRRKEAEDALEAVRQQKKTLMDNCVKEMKSLIEKHYDHLLAYHGVKTMNELIDYAVWKKEDLLNFRKTLFKLMLHYRLNADDTTRSMPNDDNTIELKDIDNNAVLLFGEEGNKRTIPYCFAQGGVVLSEAFNEFKRKKAKFETRRSGLSHTSNETYDKAELEKEIIDCIGKHENSGIVYTPLKDTSVLPDTAGVEMDDIDQGQCGDCYFMATLAAIAKMNPEYIIGKNGMIEELPAEDEGDEHRFFRVKFYDEDGKRVNVDVDNRFWNLKDKPYYAGKGKSETPGTYDPWVMAVEKAWAKANDDGYEGIEGASADGKEHVRRVEYSFAVTGKSAFYCMTKNVPDSGKLLTMMKKHFVDDHLPITLYSASDKDPDFTFTDDNLVHNHAYALRSVNDDNTFDIFNPWNSNGADENVRGKHYEKVDINFIKKNFDVVVFFGIKEADFESFERELTDRGSEDEVTKNIDTMLKTRFEELHLEMRGFDNLLTTEEMENTLVNSNYLYSKNKIKDTEYRDTSRPLVFLEGGKEGVCDNANNSMMEYLQTHLSAGTNLFPLLRRDDEMQNLTLLRISPHFVLESFK